MTYLKCEGPSFDLLCFGGGKGRERERGSVLIELCAGHLVRSYYGGDGDGGGGKQIKSMAAAPCCTHSEIAVRNRSPHPLLPCENQQLLLSIFSICPFLHSDVKNRGGGGKGKCTFVALCPFYLSYYLHSTYISICLLPLPSNIFAGIYSHSITFLRKVFFRFFFFFENKHVRRLSESGINF